MYDDKDFPDMFFCDWTYKTAAFEAYLCRVRKRDSACLNGVAWAS